MDRIERLDQIPRNAPLFFFGAGGGGQLLKKATNRLREVRLIGFIDNAKGGSRIGNIPVMDLAAFLRVQTTDTRIVISSQYAEVIAEQLRGAGVQEFHDASPLVQALVEKQVEDKEFRRLVLLCLIVFWIVAAVGWMLLPGR